MVKIHPEPLSVLPEKPANNDTAHADAPIPIADPTDVASEEAANEDDVKDEPAFQCTRFTALHPVTDTRVPRTIAAAFDISFRVSDYLAKAQLTEDDGSGNLKNAFEGLDTKIYPETKLYPTRIPVLMNTVECDTEHIHNMRVERSKCRLSLLMLLFVVSWGASIWILWQLVSAGSRMYITDVINEHFMGWQLAFNTQKYHQFYRDNGPLLWCVPFMSFVGFSTMALVFRLYRFFTSERDIGYGVVTCRVKLDLSFKIVRFLCLCLVIAAMVVGSDCDVPTVVDRFYEVKCELSPLYGRDANDPSLEGTAVGTCSKYVSNNLLSNERNYIGEIPDNDAANAGFNVTMYLPPVGQELGCPLQTPLFDEASTNFSSRAEWRPFIDKPKRRCLSQKGYVFSNWMTMTSNCSAASYVAWMNRTQTSGFGHAEQWFCPRMTSDNGRETILEYDTAGWVSSYVGSSCLAPNDTAKSTATAAFGAITSSSASATVAVDGQAQASYSQSLVGDATVPAGCKTVQFACGRVGDGSYVRALSFHGCPWRLRRPETRDDAQHRLASSTSMWQTSSTHASILVSADALLDTLEAILIYAFF